VSVALSEPRSRRKSGRGSPSKDVLVAGRGLRRSLRAALRAGRSEVAIAAAAGVPTASVRLLLDGCTFATGVLAEKLDPQLTTFDREVLVGCPAQHVPYEAVAPLVEEAVDRHGAENAARLAGIPARRLLALRTRETRAIQFETADKLVTRLDSPARWQEPPLRRWYWASTAGVG